MPKISVCIPIYNMSNAVDFLRRNLDSILMQTFKDYEIVVTDDSSDDMLQIWMEQHKYPVRYFKNSTGSGMARNTNYAMGQANGQLIKILYQDDYFYHEDALQHIVDNFKEEDKWLVTGCTHAPIEVIHYPTFNRDRNTIGSPSVLTMRSGLMVAFDPKLHWILDLDLYRRLFEKFGPPKILNEVNVVIGIGTHQSTFLLSDRAKQIEEDLMK